MRGVVSTVTVGDVEEEIVINAPADQSQIKALVLILGGAQDDPYVKDSTKQLVDAQYATLFVNGADEMEPERLVQVFSSVADNSGHPLPQALLAFGASGPLAWQSVSLNPGTVGGAFFISAPLPSKEFDFDRLRETSIRAIFTEGGSVHESSYDRAHIPMAQIPTPHDFLIFGGGARDNYYDETSGEFQKATWDATLLSMSEWFDLWTAEGPRVGLSHNHIGAQ